MILHKSFQSYHSYGKLHTEFNWQYITKQMKYHYSVRNLE